jgi:hypothetical protein
MCDGWNNKLFNLVGHAHLSIWRVVEWCQKEEATVRTIIQQDAVGYPQVGCVLRPDELLDFGLDSVV